MSVYEGFKLILNCDFVAVADRKFCQVFYGKEKLLEEEIAAYSFYDDESFDHALRLARHFSRRPYFEKMWSAKKFGDQPGGYICMKRLEGPAFAEVLLEEDRHSQLRLCVRLAEAIAELHREGVAHGALDEESVLFDPHSRLPIVLETITVFFKDQLEKENLAPEQVEGEALLIPTDIFWFANLYLKKIKRPSRALRKLILRCTHADLEKRPTIETVLSELRHMDAAEWPRRFQSLWKPGNLARLAGMLVFLGAGVVALLDWHAQVAARDRQATAYQFIDETLARADQLPTIDDKIRVLRQEIPHANTVQRSILINNIREQLAGRDFPVIDNLDNSIQAAFYFANPMLFTKEGTLGLGSILEAHNEQGTLFDMQRRRLFLQTAQGSTLFEITHPYLLSTTGRDTSNIFIPGGQENMRTIFSAIAEFYGLEIVDQGGRDGIISGYFSAKNIEDFLSQCTGPLNISFQNGVITILPTEDLRIFAPILQLPLEQYDSFKELMQFLASPTGYQLEFANLGALEHLDISKMRVLEINWKDLLKELGAVYRLENRGGETTLIISQGEISP